MKKLLGILMAVILLTGCDKYIDINEKGKVIPTTIDDYYDIMCDYNTFTMSTSNSFMASDEIHVYKDEVNRIFFGSDLFTNAYLWKDFMYVNELDNDPDWNNLYKTIYKSNVVLDKIDKAVGSDEGLRKKTKGEALAQRAYAYFMLVNQYARHYDPATFEKDLAVPLYLEADINAAKPRATVKEVYDLVENDLKASLDMLPPTPEFNYHPSQAGVNGLLAKVYLYQGKYELAKQKAAAALEVYNFLYNFKDYDFIPGLPKFLGLAGFPSRAMDNKEGLWHKQASNPFVYMIACYMTDEHRALYAPKDRRLYFTLIEDAPFGNNLHGLNIMPKERYFKGGVYTPELYLIRAECNARLHQPGLAIDDVNKIRENRFLPADFVPIDRNKTDLEALDIVLKERRMELFTESWRWFDLKRLNLDPRFKRDISRNWGGETITLKPENKNYIFPIPKKVMALNTLMEQNPRDNRQ
jgi:hypothetical protein